MVVAAAPPTVKVANFIIPEYLHAAALVEPSGEVMPHLQGLHDVDPADIEKKPSEHFVQSVAPLVATKLPAGQG